MADTLKSIVAFTAVAQGASATLPHNLSLYGVALKPDALWLGSSAFEITATSTTTVTVKNIGEATLDCDVLCEAWHPIERHFGNPPDDGSFGDHLIPQPFVAGQAPSGVTTVGSIVYGSGQDGASDFDGANTFTFAGKVGSVYTLTRDCFIAGPSFVRAGCTLYTAGFRVFCRGKLTVEATGVIHNDGKPAVGVTAGANSAIGTTGVGAAGGNGHTGVGAGINGSSIQPVNTVSDASPIGGAGGAGGVQGGGLGGAYVTSSTNGGANYITPMQTGFLFTQQTGGISASINIIQGGAGGGGGGSDNAGVNGGGGGGGGGVLVLHAFELENNGTIRTNGGNGAAAAGAGGNGGGGGGGGGGIILSLAARRYGTGIYQMNAGSGGTQIASGVAGSDGSPGHQNLFFFPV